MSRACVVPLIVCLASASTQERGPVRSSEAQPPIFSSRAELVVAHVTVKDRQGACVTSLPEEAFRVFEDGAPQRIDFFTGEINGGIYTEKKYDNYRLVVEYKWGTKMWPPRENGALDSGLFLHCGDEDGVAMGQWPANIEFQIYQGATGDIVILPGKDGAEILVKLDLGQAEYGCGHQAEHCDSDQPRPIKRDPRDTFEAESEGPHQGAIAPARRRGGLKASYCPGETIREPVEVTRILRGQWAPRTAPF